MATRTTSAAARVAATYQDDLATTGDRLATILAGLWRRTDLTGLPATWTPLVDQAIAAFTAAQLVAAEMADAYLDQVLAAQHTPRPAAGRVAPDAFAGRTASGMDLADLLAIPADRAGQALRRGVDPQVARQAGRALLGMYARTEVADAGRGAAQAALASRRVRGYYRALRAPSCARCAILAGRFYRWSAGFARHPHCDCVHVPAENDADPALLFNPRQAILDGDVHGLSKAETRAIQLGANPGQIVNARDGMYTAGGIRYTTTGTTRRGVAGARILARDIAQARGAAPGGTYRNFTLSRAELQQAQAQYSGLLGRGNSFTRQTKTGDQQTYAYRYARSARPAVGELLGAARDQDDAIRLLINNGYLL